MIHRLAPSPAPGVRIPDRLDGPDGRKPGHCGAVFVYGRLREASRARLLDALVKIGGSFVRSPRRAATVVLAHAAAANCIGPAHDLVLPFTQAAGSTLLSENAFRRLLGLPEPPLTPPASPPYTLADVARLSGLTEAACNTLQLFDVIAPGGGPLTYSDLATARQVAQLLDQGLALPAIVAAAATLGQRGLRVSHVRLAQAPWGGIVQKLGTSLARLDGQFTLVLDDEGGDAEDSFGRAHESEEAGDLVEAERWYRRAEQADRSDPAIAFNLGNVLSASGRVPEAMIAYRRALDRDPSFAQAAFNLARLYEDSGQPDGALPWYRTAIAAHPSYAQALYNAARLLTGLCNYAEALPLWERFVAMAPDDPDIGHARRLALLCRMELR